MAEDWIMTRLPRDLHALLRVLGQRWEAQRVAGHPAFGKYDCQLPIHTIIERLLAHYDRHATRRATSARRCKARQRARLHVHEDQDTCP